MIKEISPKFYVSIRRGLPYQATFYFLEIIYFMFNAALIHGKILDSVTGLFFSVSALTYK